MLCLNCRDQASFISGIFFICNISSKSKIKIPEELYLKKKKENNIQFMGKKYSFDLQGVNYTINYNEHFKTLTQYCSIGKEKEYLRLGILMSRKRTQQD